MRIALLLALILHALPAAGAPCHGRTGIASWYGAESGHKTASGAYFDGSSMTAAMWGPRFGTRFRVTAASGRSVIVEINDRGPAPKLHRLIDLSRAAARRIGLNGLGRVCVEPV